MNIRGSKVLPYGKANQEDIDMALRSAVSDLGYLKTLPPFLAKAVLIKGFQTNTILPRP